MSDSAENLPSFGPLGPWMPLIVLSVILALVYVTSGIMLPFLFGFAVAYFLDPVADRVEEFGAPRGIAAILVISVFFLGFAGLLLGMWPILSSQIGLLVDAFPGALASARTLVEGLMQDLSDNVDPEIGSKIESAAADAAATLLVQLERLLAEILTSGLALFNLISLMLVSPVVAFYLLRDWDDIVARVDGWLPNSWGGEIRREMREIDSVLAGFVRGQITVCVIMGVLYGFGWWLVGLDFALLLGLLAGVMAFIPFVGVFVALALALLVALGQWGFDPTQIALVFAVFGVVQLLEGMVLTPNLVGDSVGLHPVWVLFAVFAGGEILGFVGVLIAVPAAAALAVVARYALKRYLHHFRLGQFAPVNTPDS